MTRSSASRAPGVGGSPPPKPRGGRSGRLSSKFGTVNYSVDEMRRLNAKVRTVLPLAGEDWLHVAYQFNYLRPEAIPYREVESLKRKFKKMYCSRGSGGRLPDYVEEAKELRRLINERSDRAADGKSNGTESETAVEKTAEEVEETEEEAAAGEQSQLLLGAEEERRKSVVTETETARDMAVGLRQMEEDYHRTLERKRPGSVSGENAAVVGTQDGTEEVAATATASATATATAAVSADGAVTATPPGIQIQPSSGSAWLTGETPTSGVIAMLKHSYERKRRTVEEQMLCESARVRRERKKRKMEQVLLSIHQEQREREREIAGNGVGASTETGSGASTPVGTPSSSSVYASQHHAPSPSSGTPAPPSFYPIGSLNQPAAAQDTSSLGLMELLLQFMTAQQLENAQRLEAEQARREQERREREEQRHREEQQRRREHRELMLAMAALLGDRFPDSLKHYLEVGDQLQQQQSTAPASSVMAALGVGPATHVKGTASDVRSNQSPAVSAPTQAIATNRNDFVNEAGVKENIMESHEEHQTGLGVDEDTSAVL